MQMEYRLDELHNLSHLPKAVCLISYGVRIFLLIYDSRILRLIPNYLPPRCSQCKSTHADITYSLLFDESSASYVLNRGEELFYKSQDIHEFLDVFDSDMRIQIATSVKDLLFVHAGVVEWKAKAIILPGSSYTGKTHLVKELLRAGATYYSDEYAVFDSDGLVHSYPRPLSLRSNDGNRTERVAIDKLTDRIGSEALPVGMILDTHYVSGGSWNPEPISSCHAALVLFGNTIVARLRPEFALPILACVAANAQSYQGERGEAIDTVSTMLQMLK